jgi:hypothetical protein
MTQEHVARIAVAQDHHGLCVVAKEILELLADPAGMVCGPISTGGLGSVEANIQHFNKAIESLCLLKSYTSLTQQATIGVFSIIFTNRSFRPGK